MKKVSLEKLTLKKHIEIKGDRGAQRDPYLKSLSEQMGER